MIMTTKPAAWPLVLAIATTLATAAVELPLGLVASGTVAAQSRSQIFVDANGGSDQIDTGTREKPWKTVGFVVQRMNPGDECVFARECLSGTHHSERRPGDPALRSTEGNHHGL
jgi:hypothetical protein